MTPSARSERACPAAAGEDGGASPVRRRIRALDALRGLAVVSMVLFHLCYDLRYLCGVGMPWFGGFSQDLWRASISWTFLLIAGAMCPQSRNNLGRALRYLACAALVFVASLLAGVDTPISFGIIFCMGASTLVAWLVSELGLPRGRPAEALLLFLAFLLALGIPSGGVGLGDRMWIALPRALYSTPWLSWLGFPGPTFASGDYYPLLPYSLLFLSGASLGGWLVARGYPDWAYDATCPPLEFVGRHALAVYLLHQPLILIALDLWA